MRIFKKPDPKYLGIPNIQFSLTEKDDKREKKFAKQRIKQGFDDSETWSLRDTIAGFIIPRLKRFKEVNNGYPSGIEEKQWDNIIDKMLKAFELVVRDNGVWILTEEEHAEFKEGFKLFYEYYMHLWW